MDFGAEDWTRSKSSLSSRPPAEYWDVLPVFHADPLLLELFTQKGLRWGPVLNLKDSAFYNMLSLDFLEWLVFLARGRRVRCWVFHPPAKRWRPLRPLPPDRRRIFDRCEEITWYLFRLIGRLGGAACVILPGRGRDSVGDHVIGSAHRLIQGQRTCHASCALGSPCGRSFCFVTTGMSPEALRAECPGCTGHVPLTSAVGAVEQGLWPPTALRLAEVVEAAVLRQRTAAAPENPYSRPHGRTDYREARLGPSMMSGGGVALLTLTYWNHQRSGVSSAGFAMIGSRGA